MTQGPILRQDDIALAPLPATLDGDIGASVRSFRAQAGAALRSIAPRLPVLLAFVALFHLLFIYKATVMIADTHAFFIRLYVFLSGSFLISRFFIVIFYRDSHAKTFRADEYPSVSFVIAAMNEEDSIYRTIKTCLETEYPGAIELIAVNDGSRDATLSQMRRAEAELSRAERPVRVINFDTNRGKREGMAEGVLAASGDIVVFVDSDSFVAPDAVRHLVEHFIDNPKIGGVAGNTGVDNEAINALTKMQSARYGISFDVFKACESVFGAVTCCPGCFSAYRRTSLLSVLEAWRTQTFLGTQSTFGDDRSLTNHILREHAVVYCRSAKAVTIVPERYAKFLKQQLRWKKSWIREGMRAASFFWKKHPIASVSFYINLILPIASPLVVFSAVVVELVWNGTFPAMFLGGISALALLYGLFYFWLSGNRYWWYTVPFTLFYTLVLVWQMPYALLRLRDTRWGTR